MSKLRVKLLALGALAFLAVCCNQSLYAHANCSIVILVPASGGCTAACSSSVQCSGSSCMIQSCNNGQCSVGCQ
jgi:hypothetical protein